MFDEPSYKTTIGVDFFSKHFLLLDKPVDLRIWDTAGQERYHSMARSYYRSCSVLIVAYDMGRLGTIDSIPHWIQDVEKVNNDSGDLSKQYEIFIVGLKQDLCSGPFAEAATQAGIDLARRYDAEYWEVSAKTGRNVVEFFDRVAAVAFEQEVLSELRVKESQIPISSAKLHRQVRPDQLMVEHAAPSTCDC